jgi:hypothetical protein
VAGANTNDAPSGVVAVDALQPRDVLLQDPVMHLHDNTFALVPVFFQFRTNIGYLVTGIAYRFIFLALVARMIAARGWSRSTQARAALQEHLS